MKSLKTRLTIAAAALAVVAGSASAQSLKAEIPFTFHTQNATLLPGSYLISTAHATGRQYVIVRNADTGAAAILAQYFNADTPWAAKGNDQARLMFECAGRTCVLRELWKGRGNGGFKFVGPKLPRGEDSRMAEVAITSTKTD
jgi:hypothetical protein